MNGAFPAEAAVTSIHYILIKYTAERESASATISVGSEDPAAEPLKAQTKSWRRFWDICVFLDGTQTRTKIFRSV